MRLLDVTKVQNFATVVSAVSTHRLCLKYPAKMQKMNPTWKIQIQKNKSRITKVFTPSLLLCPQTRFQCPSCPQQLPLEASNRIPRCGGQCPSNHATIGLHSTVFQRNSTMTTNCVGKAELGVRQNVRIAAFLTSIKVGKKQYALAVGSKKDTYITSVNVYLVLSFPCLSPVRVISSTYTKTQKKTQEFNQTEHNTSSASMESTNWNPGTSFSFLFPFPFFPSVCGLFPPHFSY